MTKDPFIELRRIEAAYQAALGRSHELAEQRKREVRRLLDDGHTHKQVADAVGKARGWVGQLVHRYHP